MWTLIEATPIWPPRTVYGHLLNPSLGHKSETRLLYKRKYPLKRNDSDFSIKKEKLFVTCNKLKHSRICLNPRRNKQLLGAKEISSEITLLCYLGTPKEGNTFHIASRKIVNILVNFIAAIFVFDTALELKDLRVLTTSTTWELITVAVNWTLSVSNRVIGPCL